MPLTTQSVKNVRALLDGATKEGPTGVNGLVFVAVDRSGHTLVEHASGTRSVNSKEPMDMDTSFCKYVYRTSKKCTSAASTILAIVSDVFIHLLSFFVASLLYPLIPIACPLLHTCRELTRVRQ